MNIVKRELRVNLKSIIIWSIAMSLLVAVWMVEYEAFSQTPAIDDFLASLPQGLLAAMGMQDFSLANLSGYVGSIVLYLYLLLGMQAVLLGSSIVSKEERDKTGEYLFSLPLSREKIMMGKTISALIIIIILNLVTLASMILSTIAYDKSENFYLFVGLTFLSLFIVQMIFLSLGMFVSSVNKSYKKSSNMAVSLLMLTFLLSSLVNMVERLEFLKYLTPFKYFDSSYIQSNLSLDPVFLILSILITVLGVAGSFVFYPKRDLLI